MVDKNEKLTETEHVLIDHILTRFHQIPGYAPGWYKVSTVDEKWSREYYALCAIRAKAVAILDRGDDGKTQLVAELIRPDHEAVPVEALIQPDPDKILPDWSQHR